MPSDDSSQAPQPADDTTPAVAPSNVPVRRRTRTPMTQERMDNYCRVLAETGSHAAATIAASPYPNEVQKGSEKHGGTTPPSCTSSFAMERKTNPAFASAVDAALMKALAKAETELTRRMFLPTERASLSRDGSVVHLSLDYRNADTLLKTFLARHSPDWIEKKSIDSTSTVTVNNVGGSGGSGGFLITPADMTLLEDEEKRQLGTLLRTLMERKADAAQAQPAPQLPAPSDPSEGSYPE